MRNATSPQRLAPDAPTPCNGLYARHRTPGRQRLRRSGARVSVLLVSGPLAARRCAASPQQQCAVRAVAAQRRQGASIGARVRSGLSYQQPGRRRRRLRLAGRAARSSGTGVRTLQFREGQLVIRYGGVPLRMLEVVRPRGMFTSLSVAGDRRERRHDHRDAANCAPSPSLATRAAVPWPREDQFKRLQAVTCVMGTSRAPEDGPGLARHKWRRRDGGVGVRRRRVPHDDPRRSKRKTVHVIGWSRSRRRAA